MSQRILVPLDGSPLSEGALNEVLTLAKLPDTKVILLHVIPPIEDVIGNGDTIAVDEQWETRRTRALQYLQSLCARPDLQTLKAECIVEMGRPADVILDLAQKNAVDRIVMSTHGRKGVSRWVYGSVADKVLRAADRTVVLVRSKAPGQVRP